MPRSRNIAVLALALAFAAAPVLADGKGKGHGKNKGNDWKNRDWSQPYNLRGCPPGLAKKNNGCLPPGIAKQRFNVGDRWTGNFNPWTYNQIPLDWRTQYQLDQANRYYYRDGYLYSVDPRTRLVESVIRALIH